MESFKEKLDNLNYHSDMQGRLQKHMATLNIVSLDEMSPIIGYLLEKGVVAADKEKMIIEPDDFPVLTMDFEELKQRVEEYERLGELDALKEDLSRLTSKSATKNLEYLKQIGKQYKTFDGKYSNVIFRASKFKKEYGRKEVSQEPKIESVPVKEEQIPTIPMPTSNNPYDEILSKPQTIGLTNENYDRYKELADHIHNIVSNVYGLEEVNNNIINNLIKLVTNNIPDDREVVLHSMIYGHNVSEDEINKLKEAINDEFDYTNILDLNLGGRAA